MLFDETQTASVIIMTFITRPRHMIFSATIQQAISQTRTLPLQKKSVWQFFELDKLLGKDKKSTEKALKSHTP